MGEKQSVGTRAKWVLSGVEQCETCAKGGPTVAHQPAADSAALLSVSSCLRTGHRTAHPVRTDGDEQLISHRTERQPGARSSLGRLPAPRHGALGPRGQLGANYHSCTVTFAPSFVVLMKFPQDRAPRCTLGLSTPRLGGPRGE